MNGKNRTVKNVTTVRIVITAAAALCALLLTLSACTGQPSAPTEAPPTGTVEETAENASPSTGAVPSPTSDLGPRQTSPDAPTAGVPTENDGTSPAVTPTVPTETPTTETPTTETPTTETPTTETPTTETPAPRPALALSGSAVSNTGKAINVYFEYGITEGEDDVFTVRVTAYLDHYSLICTKRTSGNNITIGGEVFPFSTPSYNFENVKHRTLLAESETVFTPETLPPELTLSACWLFNGTYSGKQIGLIQAETTIDLTDYARPQEEPAPAETEPAAATFEE